MGLVFRKLRIFISVFDWLFFVWCITSFSSLGHCLYLCGQFLMLFHRTQSRFFQSNHMLMYLSLETLTSIQRGQLTYSAGTDRPGELCYNFTILNGLLWFQTVTFMVLLFWISFFLHHNSFLSYTHMYIFLYF